MKTLYPIPKCLHGAEEVDEFIMENTHKIKWLVENERGKIKG